MLNVLFALLCWCSLLIWTRSAKEVLVLESYLDQVSLSGVFILRRDVTINCLHQYIDLMISGPPPWIHIFKIRLDFEIPTARLCRQYRLKK